MKRFLLFFSSLLILAFNYQFTLDFNDNKLLTWLSPSGVQQKLLISQKSTVMQKFLVKKQTLPLDFIVDENCLITESADLSTLYQLQTRKITYLNYVYMTNNTIVQRKEVQLASKAEVQISDDIVLEINQQEFSGEESNSESYIYLFNNQSLVELNSKLYSDQPSCYMLSRMTSELCFSQQCMTLTPSNLFEMQTGILIKNFTRTNQLILLSNSTIENNTVQINLKLSSSVSTDVISTDEENVSISLDVKVSVDFEISLIQGSSNSLTTEDENYKKVRQTSIQYNVKIVVKNSDMAYTLKTVKIINGNTEIISEKVFFKPNQKFLYDMVWKKDKNEVPSVEIYNENLELQGKFSMNNYIDMQTDKNNQIIENNTSIIQETPLEEVQIIENKQNMLFSIVFGSVGGFVFVTLFVLVFCCRKRIINRLCPSQTQQKQAKKEEKNVDKIVDKIECDKKQSGRQLNIPWEFTFEKRDSVFCQLPSFSTQDKSFRQNDNNKSKSQKHQCSISQNIPSDHFSSQQERKSEEIKSQPVQFQKHSDTFYSERQTPGNVSISQTRKKIKGIKKNRIEKDDEQTQNV